MGSIQRPSWGEGNDGESGQDNQDDGVLAIRLLGGLGNQLFQAAAAHYHANGRRVVLITGWGGVSSRSSLVCDLEGFELPNQWALRSPRQFGLPRPLMSLAELATLTGLRCRRSGTAGLIHGAIQGMSPFLTRAVWRPGLAIVGGIGTGFTPIQSPRRRDLLLSGYFQAATYARFLRDTHSGIALRPKMDEPWLEQMRELSAAEEPLVLHVRLNDYVNSPLFGAVRSDYYSRALNFIAESVAFGRIWIFSDEPSRVWDFLPPKVANLNPRLVTDQRGRIHPSTMMAAMSLGSAFILTNSTFGYWAAMLGNGLTAPVTVPRPWFANGQDVPELIPENWKQLDRESMKW